MFRTAVVAAYGGEVEFACPHGVEWGEMIAPPAMDRTAEEQAACQAICDECEHQLLMEHDRPGCRLLRHAGCTNCGARFALLLVNGVCPDGRWPARESSQG